LVKLTAHGEGLSTATPETPGDNGHAFSLCSIAHVGRVLACLAR